MNNQPLHDYIAAARDKGRSDEEIKQAMVSAGWDPTMVDGGLHQSNNDDLLVPPPPPPQSMGVVSATPTSATGPAPVAVVQQRTTRGLEYSIMFLALGFTAVALTILLNSAVTNLTGNDPALGDTLGSYATAAIIVALPIFAYLFFRLKKAEYAEPEIRKDASRRHAIQLTLIITFIWGIISVITYIYSLLNSSTDVGGNGETAVANLLHTAVSLLVSGTIFIYYWRDEHRTK